VYFCSAAALLIVFDLTNAIVELFDASPISKPQKNVL
jgi:hypothetical protein